MAKYPPQKGEIWKLNNQYFRITGIDSQTNDVLVEKIDGNNISTAKPISKKQWEKREYEYVPSGKKEKEITNNSQSSSEFLFNIDENGVLSISQNGKVIQKFDIRGPEGKPGTNGMPGQNGAPGQKGQDGAPGQPGQDGAPGEKGQDGAPGKDGAPGPEGKQGPTGPKGQDGKLWRPEISEDGTELRFVNENNENDHTSWYPIQGKKGDQGSDGIQGRRGPDGAVFSPKINSDGVLSWSNNGDGLKNPEPIRVTGKSAFELWQDLPSNGGKTLKDFFDFLKGEKGDPGLDGIVREAKHSYLEIKDFTCPVQEIDTTLIANSSDSAKTPEEIVEDRIKEIDDLRKLGNKVIGEKEERREKEEEYEKETVKRKKYHFYNGKKNFKNWAGCFKEFTWWCAGADRPLLRMCPGDHSKYTGIGTVILFTALMAWFSSYIAMRLVFGVNDDLAPSELLKSGANWAAIGFATFWALMIFFLDRFITNTMYSDGKVTISKEEFIGGLPRILIAIFLGVVISAPLELRIFEQEINDYLKTGMEAQIRDEVKTLRPYISAEEKVKTLKEDEGELKSQYQTTLKSPNDTCYNVSKYHTVSNGTKTEQYFDNNTKKYKSKNVSAGTSVQTTKERDNNLYIQACSRDSLAYENAKKATINAKKELSTIDSVLTDSLRTQYDINDYADQCGLHEKLQAMHAIAMKVGEIDGYKPLFSSDLTQNNRGSLIQENSSYDFIVKSGLSVLFFVLLCCLFKVKFNRKVGNVAKGFMAISLGCLIGCGYEIFHYMWYYLTTPIGLIMLLFILIDISPVLYKMMLADGVYDNYLHQEKLLKQDKIRLSLARMLRKIDKGELKALSPFIMGKIYRKMYKFSAEENTDSDKDYKHSVNWGTNTDALDSRVEEENKKVFETVLDYKRRIILASYAAWYRDMRDAFIGSRDDENGEKISPEDILFNNPNFENGTQEDVKQNNGETKGTEQQKQTSQENTGDDKFDEESSANNHSGDEGENIAGEKDDKQEEGSSNVDDEYERIIK